MAIRPLLIDKGSPFVGEHCALCREPFSPGEEIIVCPEDGTRHHVYCWRANGNQCAAYGCRGHGEPIERAAHLEEAEDEPLEGDVVQGGDSKVHTLPSSSFSCAQTCLIMAIALSIILIAVSCFGLWAMFDYIMIEVLGWKYREPLSQAVLLPALIRDLSLLFP